MGVYWRRPQLEIPVVKCSPNPAQSAFTIEYKKPNASPFDLTIYDNPGPKVLFMPNQRQNKIIVDTRKIENGLCTFEPVGQDNPG